MLRVRCMPGCRAGLAAGLVAAGPSWPAILARKFGSRSSAFGVGWNSTMRKIEPLGGGGMPTLRMAASVLPEISAGVASVTQRLKTLTPSSASPPVGRDTVEPDNRLAAGVVGGDHASDII